MSSINGDLNLNSMLGNINIEAGESTYSQSSKSNSRNLGGSFGTNGLSANIGFNESQNSFDQTTFSNSQISAINGNLNINTKQDLKIFGANLLSKNVNLNIGNNFLLKSRQNLSESDSYNIGGSIGLSGNPSGINGGSLGLNLGNGYSNKAFVEDISSIIGNNSVNIHVANDTTIAGALIANQNNRGIDLGNLNLKTKSLTYSDLNNFSVSNSNQLSTNLQAGYNPNNPTQNGNLAINLSMQGRESSSTTRATIGNGNIIVGDIINDETKLIGLNRDVNNVEQNKTNLLTSDFEAELKIDLRLLGADGNLAGSLDDVTKTTFKDTTSKEAIKNYAIAAVVAGAAYGVGQWMKSEGINPSFESGTMENSKVGVNAKYNSNGVLIKEGSITIQNPNGIETNYWASNQNPAFKTLNTTPGAPSFADFHDAMNFEAGVNQVTIAPYYAMSQCAASPTLCATFPDIFIKVGTWGQVDTNLDTNKNDYEKNN
ncbi:MAG: hypothetical protein RL769_110 [Pseudomonadota bacterium]